MGNLEMQMPQIAITVCLPAAAAAALLTKRGRVLSDV